MQTTSYIVNDKGQRISAIVPIKKYQQLLEEAEELKDISLYDKVKSLKEESIPFEEYVKQRRKRKNA